VKRSVGRCSPSAHWCPSFIVTALVLGIGLAAAAPEPALSVQKHARSTRAAAQAECSGSGKEFWYPRHSAQKLFKGVYDRSRLQSLTRPALAVRSAKAKVLEALEAASVEVPPPG
jgi:hypothetical protein